MELQKNKNELTIQQKAFVGEYVRNGGNGTQAAIVAGYSERTADVQASRLLTKPKIREAVNKDTVELAERSAPMALQTLVGVLEDPTASNRDKIIAAREILDRGPLRKKDGRMVGINLNVGPVSASKLLRELEEKRKKRLAKKELPKKEKDYLPELLEGQTKL